jgi:O-antigen/teichoic acid export membrane protein
MRALLKQTIFRPSVVNASTLFLGTAVARVLSALVVFIVARQLGLEQFGVYTAVWSLAKLTSFTFSLGLDSWLLKDAQGNKDYVGRATATALVLKAGLGALWLVIVVTVAPYLSQEIFPVSLMVFSALAVWFEEVDTTALASFKAALRNKTTVWLIMSSQLILLLVTIAVASTGSENPGFFLGARALATGLGMLISLFFVFRRFKIQLYLSDLPIALRETFSFGVSHGLAVIYGKADITMVAYFLGSTAAGIYSPSSTLMATLFLVPTAVYEVMLPVFSRMRGEGDRQIEKKSFQLILISTGLGMLLGVGLALTAYPLVWLLYSAEFLASAPVLVILSNILLFKCISFALAAILAAVGWQGKRVWIQLATSVLNIGLNLLVVRSYGVFGVAYVYVLTEFLLTLGYLGLLLLWQRENLMLNKWHSAKL